jgi:phage gp46-like protein
MQEFGITALQTKPSLFKQMTISKIVDRRKDEDIGYFISSKYESMISSILKEIEKKEKIEKLKLLKEHQDLEFLEVGIDDGLK